MVTLAELKNVQGRYCFECGEAAEVRLPEGAPEGTAYCLKDAREKLRDRSSILTGQMRRLEAGYGGGTAFHIKSQELDTVGRLLTLLDQV